MAASVPPAPCPVAVDCRPAALRLLWGTRRELLEAQRAELSRGLSCELCDL